MVVFQPKPGTNKYLGLVSYCYVSVISTKPAPRLFPNFLHISSLQHYLPWGNLSTWTSPISLISYCNPRLPTTSSHRPCHGPVLTLLVPLPPSNICGWVVCPFPRRSLLLLYGCPAVSDLSTPPERPLPKWP